MLIGPQGVGLPLPFVDQIGKQRKPGTVYVMRRELFDNVLFQHARSLPAVTAVEGFTFSDFLYDCGHIAGLVGTDHHGRQRRYGASIVIGADGAMSRVAERAGAYDFSHTHHQHWIAAFRVYFRGVGGLIDTMEIHLLDELLPGYFWIFLVGAGEANVGAGMVESAVQGREGNAKINLRKRTYQMLATHPRLRDRFAGARGGWQRCSGQRSGHVLRHATSARLCSLSCLAQGERGQRRFLALQHHHRLGDDLRGREDDDGQRVRVDAREQGG